MKRKPSQKRSQKERQSLCGQPGPEDGLDPREFFKPHRHRRDPRKDWQLCRQVSDTLNYVLSGESHDEILRDLYDSYLATWLPEPLSADVKASIERIASSDDVRHIAVMPDVHLGNDVCNGIAIATKELLYPSAVGSDIGCGMLAVGFDLETNVLSEELAAGRVLAGLYQSIRKLTSGTGRIFETKESLTTATIFTGSTSSPKH